MVEEFQSEKYIPYMILSVKAGGTGLTLTNANHVIHFDRWWNPAVENQATDRAYRIGQNQQVMVHKLVTKGTIEEKIDAMIESKKELAENVVGSGGESWITEMSNEQLLSIFTLDEG
jgi:non-specific serine/threonine protein kinase